MLLSSPAGQRGLLEAQVKLVHDVTGKPLNEIRTDLEHTGDAQKTIERICGGKFLKGTPRDPTSKARPNSLMSPKALSLNAARGEAARQQKRKGKAAVKTAPQAFEVIDLCDSDDYSSPAVRFKRPSTFQSSDVWKGAATTGPNLAGPSTSSSSITTDSLLSIIKPYTNGTVKSKKATEGPLPPLSSPLFRPTFSSSSESPLSPFSPQRWSTDGCPGATTAPLRSHSPAAPAASTPPAPTPQPKKQKIVHIVELDDDSDSCDQPPVPRSVASPITKRPCTNLSAATRGLLQQFAESSSDSDSDLDEGNIPKSKRRISKAAPKKAITTKTTKAIPTKRKVKATSEEIVDLDEEGGTQDSSAERPTRKNNRLSEAKKARRAAEKEEVKLQRQRERDAKAAEREEAKIQKKREKEAKDLEKKMEQELLSVNKLRTSKKDSAPEMIVDISHHLKDTPTGEQLQRFLVGLGCEVNQTWYPTVGEGTWRVVKWRRKVKAEYDEGRSMFLPLPEMKVTDEYYVLVYITAKEFLDIAMNRDGSGLALHVSQLRQFSPRHAKEVKLIYLIEGLDALTRKNKSNRNRAYQNRVRAVLGAGEGRAGDAELIDEDEIQDALLELQVVHGCLIYHTAKEVETAEWISKFTGDISSIPYKFFHPSTCLERSALMEGHRKSRQIADMAFCTDVGQVKAGVGKADTYTRMLEEINRVTPSVANGVAREYPDVTALVRGFKRYGENALADLPNVDTTNDLPMSRNIGAACSKRIYGIFTDTDPDSTGV